jgi:hypothetical protein
MYVFTMKVYGIAFAESALLFFAVYLEDGTEFIEQERDRAAA